MHLVNISTNGVSSDMVAPLSISIFIEDVESQHMFQPEAGLTSAEGVKQGDPLGALLFALSMKMV